MSDNKDGYLAKKVDAVQIEGPEPERILTTSQSVSTMSPSSSRSSKGRKIYRSRGTASSRAVSSASLADSVEETIVQEPDEILTSRGSISQKIVSTRRVDSDVMSRSSERSTRVGSVLGASSSSEKRVGNVDTSDVSSDSKVKLRSARLGRGPSRPGAVSVSPSMSISEPPTTPRSDPDKDLKLKLRSGRSPRPPSSNYPGAYPVSPSMKTDEAPSTPRNDSDKDLKLILRSPRSPRRPASSSTSDSLGRGDSSGASNPRLDVNTLESVAVGKVKLRSNRRANVPGAVSMAGDGDEVSTLMSSNASLAVQDLPTEQEPEDPAGSFHDLSNRSGMAGSTSSLSLKSPKGTIRKAQKPGAFHGDMSSSSRDGKRSRLTGERPGALSVSGYESLVASRKQVKQAIGLRRDEALDAVSADKSGESVTRNVADDPDRQMLMEVVHELDTQDFIAKSAAMAPPRTGAFAIDGIPSDDGLISDDGEFEPIPEELLGPNSSARLHTRQVSQQGTATEDATFTTELPVNPLNAPVIPRDDWETERDELRREAEIKEERTSSLNYRCMVAILVVLAIGAIIGITVGVLGNKSSPPPPATPSPTTLSPSSAPSTDITFCTQGNPNDEPRYASIRDIVGQESDDLLSAIDMPDSPQREAICWLSFFDPLRVQTTDRDHLIQRYALAVLVYSFFDVEASDSRLLRSNSTWLGSTHECKWIDVFCDQRSETIVIDLLMFNANAKGAIPLELVTLTSLESFDVRNNALGDSLPDFLWTMTSLKALDLSENQFTGSVPESVSALKDLSIFFLNNNPTMSGTLPLGLTSLPIVQTIDIADAGLTGTVPTEIGLLTSVQELSIEQNALTGTIPTEFGIMTSMAFLRLGFNSFVNATIPTELGNLGTLSDLQLQEGPFIGTIPAQLGRLSNIVGAVDVRMNLLTGTIPTELGRLERANSMRFEDNEGLTGSVPSEICDLRSDVGGRLDVLTVFCDRLGEPRVECDCCTLCPI